LHIHQRHQIEGKNAGQIAEELAAAYDNVCSKKNSPEEIQNIKNYLVKTYHVNMESLNAF
jgi:hypothetical protein